MIWYRAANADPIFGLLGLVDLMFGLEPQDQKFGHVGPKVLHDISEWTQSLGKIRFGRVWSSGSKFLKMSHRIDSENSLKIMGGTESWFFPVYWLFTMMEILLSLWWKHYWLDNILRIFQGR